MTTESDEAGIWYCPVCDTVEERPASTVVARCTGVWEVTHAGASRGTEHWPVVMDPLAAGQPAQRLQKTSKGAGGSEGLSRGVPAAPAAAGQAGGSVRLSSYGRRVEDLMEPGDRVNILDGPG